MPEEFFTYLIGWSIHNKFYYGVRYKKNSSGRDLWVSYFTSSKHVKRFYNENGEPDIIQIRQCFKDPLKAKQWEDKVLRRLKLHESNLFLNLSNNKSFQNVVMTDKIKLAISKSRKENYKKRKVITNGIDHRYILVDEEIPIGWKLGISEERRLKNVDAGKSTLKNRSPEWLAEYGQKIRIKLKGKPKPKDHGKHISESTKGKPKPWNVGENNPAKTESSRKKISESWKTRIIGKWYTDEVTNFYIKPGEYVDPSWRPGKKKLK